MTNPPETPPSTNGPTPKGRLFIISAPSGAGKTTLCRAIRERLPALRYSISHTTRAPRPGERNGVDYFFISFDAFQQKIKENAWAEWAEVHGNYYGTSAAFINRHLALGHDILLDIDVKGARQILSHYPESITIFIMPPSMTVLRERLTGRGTDSEETIRRRLANAEQEMAQKHLYKHVVVNDSLPETLQTLLRIFSGDS